MPSDRIIVQVNFDDLVGSSACYEQGRIANQNVMHVADVQLRKIINAFEHVRLHPPASETACH
ncbi:MAG: hypothetical protein ACYCY7_03680 [Gallionella sp.]